MVNARNGLRRLRAAAVRAQTGYPAQPAATWLAAHQADAPDLSPDLDDDQLGELGEPPSLTITR
ncbi:hypothetical protein [Nonomuraea sp. NPDC049695]|uniref:hypothetical protein n=1 Tax=Nonomuraea sp. NPDC049695 TaxID=3154734 RepID=UPI00344A68E4